MRSFIACCAALLTIVLLAAPAIGQRTIPQGGVKKEVLTNAEIIELTKLGLSDITIIEKIRQSERQFNTSMEGLRQLKAAQVNDIVIREMINPQSSLPSSAYPGAQPEGEQPSGSGAIPEDQQFLGRYIGTGEHVTEHQERQSGRMSIDIERGNEKGKIQLKVKAWDNLEGALTLIGQISPDGQLSATGTIAENAVYIFRQSRAWNCNLRGFIRDNRFKGTYSLFPTTIEQATPPNTPIPPVMTEKVEGSFDLEKFKPLVQPQYKESQTGIYPFEAANYWYHELDVINNAADPQECAKRCDVDPRCRVASFHGPRAQGGWSNRCVLRSAIGPRHPEQVDISSWVKPQ
jgi:PAN domain.